jgi:hypothetical protein
VVRSIRQLFDSIGAIDASPEPLRTVRVNPKSEQQNPSKIVPKIDANDTIGVLCDLHRNERQIGSVPYNVSGSVRKRTSR